MNFRNLKLHLMTVLAIVLFPITLLFVFYHATLELIRAYTEK